jgi:hypothetical protein
MNEYSESPWTSMFASTFSRSHQISGILRRGRSELLQSFTSSHERDVIQHTQFQHLFKPIPHNTSTFRRWGNLRTDAGIENLVRRGKGISSGMAGSAAIPCDVIAR